MPDYVELLRKASEALAKANADKRHLQLLGQSQEERKILIAQVGADLMKMLKPSVDSLNLTKKGLREALSNIVVKTPEVTAPEVKVKVDVPKIDTSKLERTIEVAIAKAFKSIKIKAPNVTVQPATVKFPKMPKMPKNMAITGPVMLHQDSEHPMQVQMVDSKGIPILPGAAMAVGGGGGGPRIVTTNPIQERTVGSEQLTVSTSAVTLADIPKNANKAIMGITGATLRYLTSGTTPTTDLGIVMYVAGTIILNSRESILAFQAIRDGGTDSIIDCEYYEVK